VAQRGFRVDATTAHSPRPSADPSAGDLQTFKAGFFRALAHPVRIRILELLVKSDRSVQELQEALGLEQPVVSQQLAVLRSNNIVSGRKEGVSVRYAVRDPLIGTLLDTARQIFNNHLVGTADLLRQLKREDRRR
jgi:DNA-binding transcriptional ArsR family regulator